MKDEEIIRLARERFRASADATRKVREDALDDLKFVTGEQWPDFIKRQRDADGRPCLTVNKLPAFAKQVINDMRQSRPAGKVSPVDDYSDPDTAEVIEGICRHIDNNSAADVAIDTAFQSAVECGFGYWRLVTEYVDDQSFDQEIKVRRIRNPFSVYFDPTCQEVDYSDAGWCLIVADMPVQEYKAEYPHSELAGLPDMQTAGNRAPGWITEQHIRVAEYFYVEEVPVKLSLVTLPSGETRVLENVKTVPEGAMVMRERQGTKRVVKWAKINGVEVLEKRDWPGRWIPVIPVLGDEHEVDGRISLASLVRHAKDSQRMYNYWASAETEAIALAPKSPFLVAEGQIEGYEQQWNEANVRNFPYLQYKAKTAGGELIGAPQRQQAEPAIQAISHARLMSSDDMKATMGLFDAALGNRSNETSGVAIAQRKREGDNATFHFSDNLARAIRFDLKQRLDLIPKIYDTARIQRIIGLDGAVKQVPINQPHVTDGVEKVFDLTTGTYDVVVEVGPSYGTKRQESSEAMLELAKAYPPLMQVAGDLLVKNFDFPGAEALAERLEATLPPQLQPKKQGEEQQAPIPPQVQAAMQALSQQHEQLVQTVHTLQDEIDTKQAELASRERIAALQEETKRLQIQADAQIEMAKLGSSEALAALTAEVEAIKHSIQLEHEAAQSDAQRMHEAIMAPDPTPAHEAQETPEMEYQEHATGIESQE